MLYKAAALLSLVRSSVLIASAKSETSQETVSTPLASQRLKEKFPLTTTPNHKRELDLVQQTTYNEEVYTDEHRPGGYWEPPVSDDGYTIATVINDPSYNNPSNSADYMVRVLKYKRGWSQMGQDLKCLYRHATLANTNLLGWGNYVSLSGDGKVLAIGTSGTWSFNCQVDRHLVGYVDVFYYDDVTKLWEARGSRLDGSTYGANVGDRFGAGIKLSQDGTGLLLSTDSCYRKSSAGNNHDSRIDRARGFEWNESTQDWDLIFGIEKQNNVVGPCASMYAYLDVLKSKDGTKWFYALSGYHHKYNSAYVYEEDRNTGISRGLGGVIDKAKYSQLFQDENGDLRSISHNPCYPLSSCYYHTIPSQKSAWRHLKYNSSSNTWDQVQLFSGTVDGELFGHELSLSSDGHFAAVSNTPNGFSNRIYEFNPNTFQFQELALTGTYPPHARYVPAAILPMGDVITGQVKNGILQYTRFVLDPGVNWAGGGGDPHFIGFGGIFFTWQGHCDVILVKTPKLGGDGIDLEVHVRTRRIRKWSAIDAVAFRVGHEIGEISSDEGKLRLNGSEVESFQTGTITVTKSNLKKRQKLYRIVFDNDKILEVEVNTRTKMIFANLKGAYPVGTVGILGSPDNPGLHSRDGTRMTKKDTDTFVESWQVQSSDSQLFHQRRYPQFPSKCLYNMEETKVSGKRRLKEVHTVTMEDAKATCASHPPGLMREFCVEDVFQAGNLDFGEEQFYG